MTVLEAFLQSLTNSYNLLSPLRDCPTRLAMPATLETAATTRRDLGPRSGLPMCLNSADGANCSIDKMKAEVERS